MGIITKSRPYRRVVKAVNMSCPVLMAQLRYFKYFKRFLNLRNPQDLNEKITWLSLFSDTSEWTRLADKLAVRDFVKERGQEKILVNLLGCWDKAEDINWAVLPDSFVLKTTNGSGTVMVIPNKNEEDTEKIVSTLNDWLKLRFGDETTEFHYLGIVPRIIAEELIVQSEEDARVSNSLIDYKIWCFNGKAYYVWVCLNRVKGSTYVSMFDRDWNYHPEMSVFNEHYREAKYIMPRPDKLDEMLDVAEKLSAGFPEVRVDLYCTGGRIYFGEMTFTSLGGTMDFYTKEALLEMGKLVDMSSVKKIR